MDKVFQLIDTIIDQEILISGILSNLRKKDAVEYQKVDVRPIIIKGGRVYQFSYHYPKKVIHENLEGAAAVNKLRELMEQYFRQGQLYTAEADYQILISKKGSAAVLKKPPTKEAQDLSHNRKKSYIIPENEPCPFMKRLGVMNEKGKVLANKYDKFRQINRFLEMVADIVPHLKNKGEPLQIVDFGCGKSYLTFALYHYLTAILDMKVNILGLDLKEDVVNHCNVIACDLGYEQLKFITGDIRQYTGKEKIHMVVSLHACDTATDAALIKALEWDAEVILSVPCCQHELLGQLHNEVMKPMEKHGIIKERLSSLVTDSVRANILEIMGYTTQILEFISMEHTAKNLLIRAVKGGRNTQEAVEEYINFKSFWKIEPYLEKVLGERLKERLVIKKGE
ncbi:class I SAM-dependent methyltransferase [Geosporobacter ferrireducens]|uniref:SAM-dependent methyltransferase n=1 Tax=Geosporobacter ferrireducens TaxID=1424294 RepID=A0A1D8GIX2_9FIRM|nr:SAM-dependent methyltransferase [Geosporobacter ferrireducens]AOT70843.1 SAM-dependent methyltransferase [Geosporobacter ferrireducens]MTI53548.1 SAM-dependent methyltransferase [Geosporobacter ferrireducens]